MLSDTKAVKAALCNQPQAHSSRYASCMALVCMVGALNAQAADLPQGGTVIQGQVSSSRPEANALTLRQTTQTAVIEWKSFGIAEDHIVDVRQPFHDSVLLNRVMGDEISIIAGMLRAPGSVLLVNPNGVHITPTGRVTTGGFLASSLDIDNDDVYLTAAALHHKVDGKMHSMRVAHRGAVSALGGVLNEGLIQIADAGYVSLAGPRAVHDGVITSRGGHLAIAGPAYLRVEGRIDLDRRPVTMVSPMSAANTSDSVSATSPISPLSPMSPMSPMSPGVNRYDAGASRAPSEDASSLSQPGSLRLLGSRIDIHSDNLPDGAPADLSSFVHAETLAGALRDAHVVIRSVGTWPSREADNGAVPETLTVSTSFPTDPKELAVALKSSGWRAGDIHITSPVAWSADTSLKLASTGSIRIDARVTASGNDPSVSLYPGVDHDITFTGGRLAMCGDSARLAVGGHPYTLIRNAVELRQAIEQGGAQNYAITQNLDLRGIPMAPITLPASPRAYCINGLGNSVKGLAIESTVTGGVGLFSALDGQSTVSHLHLIDPDIRGVGETGAFAGVMRDQSRLIGVSVKGGNIRSGRPGSVYGSLGGIVGAMQDESVISHAHLHDVVVRGVDNVGGIAGGMSARTHIKDAVFSGTTHGRDRVGGIVGQQRGGCVERITQRGGVNGRHDVGGVAGSVGTGSLITAALSDAAVMGTGRSGAIAGRLAHGSRYRMVDNVTAKGAQHYGEDFGAYVGGYVSPLVSAAGNDVRATTGAAPVAEQNKSPTSPQAVSSTSEKFPSDSTDPISDHIRQLNPRPWNG